MPTFSVIIPTRNRAPVLERALRSVLAQTLIDLEVVVVDDGSTDRTPHVIGRVGDPRLQYVSQSHSGVSAARNAGAARSTGRYIAFLDSDDEALPGWLERLAEVLAAPNCGVACCGAVHLDRQRRMHEVCLPEDMGPPFWHQRGLFLAGTFAVRREVFDAVSGYVAGLPYSENTELALRLVPFCRRQGWTIRTVAQPLVRIHARKENRGHEEARLIGATYILRHHREQLARSAAQLADYFAVAGVSAARMGMYAESRRHFVRAILSHPRNLKNYGRLLVSMSPGLGSRIWTAPAVRTARGRAEA